MSQHQQQQQQQQQIQQVICQIYGSGTVFYQPPAQVQSDSGVRRTTETGRQYG